MPALAATGGRKYLYFNAHESVAPENIGLPILRHKPYIDSVWHLELTPGQGYRGKESIA